MTTAIEKLDAEIQKLQQEAAAAEQAPPTIAERFAAAEAELLEAERIFRTFGLNPSAPHPGETAYLQRLAVVGCCMIVGSAAILKATHQRIAAQGEGLTAADKASKLNDIRRRVLSIAAKRELAVREIEGDGFMIRPVHPELLIFPQAEVERLAA